MSQSSRLQSSLILAPLLGATGSLASALGLWVMAVVVIGVFGLVMAALRTRLVPAMHLPASVLLAATLTSCAQLGAQAWSLQWHQGVGIYSALIALQCVVLDQTAFFQHTWRERVRLGGLFGGLMVSLGVLRELIGTGTLSAGPSAEEGWHLLTLTPGALILLGLLLAAWQAWHRPPPSN